MGGVGLVACQGFTVRGTCVCVLVGRAGSLLSEVQRSASSEFWGVYGFGMALGSLSFKAQGCVPALLENLCGVSCSGTCWLLGGAWFQCTYGGFWVSSCLLIVPGVRSSLMLSVLDLSLLPLAFSLSLRVASRLLHPYSTDDKTSKLMVKQFSTARDTKKVHRVTWKRRGGGR